VFGRFLGGGLKLLLLAALVGHERSDLRPVARLINGRDSGLILVGGTCRRQRIAGRNLTVGAWTDLR
jgi:hypothetical protein